MTRRKEGWGLVLDGVAPIDRSIHRLPSQNAHLGSQAGPTERKGIPISRDSMETRQASLEVALAFGWRAVTWIVQPCLPLCPFSFFHLSTFSPSRSARFRDETAQFCKCCSGSSSSSGNSLLLTRWSVPGSTCVKPWVVVGWMKWRLGEWARCVYGKQDFLIQKEHKATSWWLLVHHHHKNGVNRT